MPEYYAGRCVWLDFPANTDPAQMQKEPLSKDLEGKFMTTDNIVASIKMLESNPTMKNAIRAGGKEFILSQFGSQRVGNMWKDFIAELLK